MSHIDAKQRWEGYYSSQLLIGSLLNRAAKHQPDTEIVTKISKGVHRTTYKAHQAQTELLASALSKWGVRPGHVVGSFMWNNARHLNVYHAVPCMGAVLHTLNIRLHHDKVGYIIQHAGDSVVFVDESLLDLLAKVNSKFLSTLKLVVICGKDERPYMGNTAHDLHNLPSHVEKVSFETLLSTGSTAGFEWPEGDTLSEYAPLALCYTSGTTGPPKGVMYSHRSQYINTMGNLIASQQGISATDAAMPVVPMFHAMAWGIPYACLALGCKLVLTNEHMKPEDIGFLIRTEGVTVMSCVPTIWQALKRELEENRDLYRCTKGVFTRGSVGGSKFSLSLLKWFWDEWGVEVVQTWGMTETNPLGTAARRIDDRKLVTANRHNRFTYSHLDTVGRPIVGVEVKVVDQATNETLPNDGKSIGELLICGPAIINGYFKKLASTSEEQRNSKGFYKGWLRTGDLATISSRGYVSLHDRAKDVIKSGGEWISSADMENHVKNMLQIKHACVIGMPHPTWDERPIVVVELLDSTKHAITLEEVRAHCSKKYAKFQLPDDVLVWKEVPVSGTGKIDKKVVRAKLRAQGYVLPKLRKTSKL